MPSSHAVQFFSGDEASFLHHLGRYITEGLDAGEPVVVMTDDGRRDRLFAALDRLGSDPDIGKEDGRLVVLNAEQVLAKIFLDGRIDPERFHAVIGRMMREVVSRSRSRRVRAYGDLVNLLWNAGRMAAALELERCWNDLQSQLPFDLYCGYHIDIFGDDFHPGRIDPLLCQHSDVISQYGAPEIESALRYAIYETLGRDAGAAGGSIAEQSSAVRPGVPVAEAMLLWLREALPVQAPAIISRARLYATSAA